MCQGSQDLVYPQEGRSKIKLPTSATRERKAIQRKDKITCRKIRAKITTLTPGNTENQQNLLKTC